MPVRADYPLLRHNTFGIPCRAKAFAEYDSPGELASLLASNRHKRILHIGQGSNLLFLHDTFDGLVLHSRIRSVHTERETDDEVCLRVGGGGVWDDFVRHAVNSGWSGAENLSFIPGEVGAAAVQNIGAYGAEACQLIESVECLHLASLRQRTFSADECRYGYRDSIFKQSERGQWAVLHVTYRLRKRFSPYLTHEGLRRETARRWGDDEASLTPRRMREAVGALRGGKLPDPTKLGNAGSFFKNPIVPRPHLDRLLSAYPDMPHYEAGNGWAKLPAAWLIERCGWKGRTLGSAAVYGKHPLVIVNAGKAKGEDILALCLAVSNDVEKAFGVALEPEVNLIA